MLGDQPDDRAIPWGQTEDVMVRVPGIMDREGLWAWQFVTPCDDTCHHPSHAFGPMSVTRGKRHYEWFEPGSKELTRVKP